MTLSIRSALDRICVVEAALTITDPETLAIARCYKYLPPRDGVIEANSFMHSYALVDVTHSINGTRKQLYVVRSQFWCGNPDKDRAADISTAFLEKWVDAFSNDLTLNGAASMLKFAGSTPATLVDLDYGNLHSIGLELALQVTLGPEAVTVGP